MSAGRKGEREPRGLGESLDRIATSIGAPGADALATVFSAWPEVVGEAVAAHCRPRSLQQSTLVVAVDEPAWAASLRWLEADIVTRLGAVTGEGVVTDLAIRVAPPR